MSVVIQLKRGTAAEWVAANPVLAIGEIGIETDTWLYKIGNGSTAWNSLAYNALRQVDNATIMLFEGQSDPSAPASGKLNLYAKAISGRMMLKIQGASGLSVPIQPAFFQNNVYMINTNTTTTISSIGDSVTSVGTISHPTVTELYGRMANFVTAGTATATAGTGNANLNFLRGTVIGSNGWFSFMRLGFPDSSYNESGASTGSRIFVGMTDQTMAVSVGADNPAGNRAGFHRLHVNGATQDTNWFFSTRDGTTQNRVDTGLPFISQHVYDFYSFTYPVGSNKIYWRIDDITAGTTAEGEVTLNLPTNTVLMRCGFQVQSVNAVARNIRMQRVYIETDQ